MHVGTVSYDEILYDVYIRSRTVYHIYLLKCVNILCTFQSPLLFFFFLSVLCLIICLYVIMKWARYSDTVPEIWMDLNYRKSHLI